MNFYGNIILQMLSIVLNLYWAWNIPLRVDV